MQRPTLELLERIVEVGNDFVWQTPEALPWLVILLLGTGLFVTVRLAFIQIRHLGHAIGCVMGKFDDPDDPGDVNHFQALSTALSATVGIGNIAGVAIAIHLGGPGAVFWMWVTAFFGMAVKFCECTLAVHYRDFDESGRVAGGPMFYIERGLGKNWKPMAVLFAICGIVCSWGSGNMNQANTVAHSASVEFGIDAWIVGLFLAGVVGAVIIGGIVSIAKVASRLVPVMGLVYVIGALLVLLLHAGEVPGALGTIFTQAFNPTAGVTGVASGGFMMTLLWGVRRGLYSNEAGQGSAPIAHAAARTDEPVREGAVALLEPMIDTLIICTMTALVIVVTGVWDQKHAHVDELSSVKVALVDPDSPDVAPAVEKGTVLIHVTEGRQATVAFEHNDSSVEDAVILRDGTPYTGKLFFRKQGDGWELTVPLLPGAPETGLDGFALQGKRLFTGAALTSVGFKVGLSALGDWGNYVVTFCVFLFALSTAISWSYYGDRCTVYLLGVRWVTVYRATFIFFVFLGANLELNLVWAYGDLALGLMSLPNLIAVLLLSPKIVELSRDYFKRMKERHG